jgi:hypothetical protein
MNKKLNTVLFLVGATVFNVLVTILSFVLLALLHIKFIMPKLSETAGMNGFIVVFIGAIAIAFVVYRFVLNRLIARIKFDDYFDPIFHPRRRPPKKD